jgi:hypothetical protein
MQHITAVAEEGSAAIDRERDSRDKSEEAMIALLEETCKKLN